MTTTDGRERAIERDVRDPLRAFREEFDIPEGLIYLDGNSLGMPPRAAREALLRVHAEWASGLIDSWDTAHWLDAPVRIGDKIGTLVGAAPGEVVVGDSTSVNLYKALTAAMRLTSGRRRLLVEENIFPTDAYIARAVAAAAGVELTTAPAHDLAARVDAACGAVLVTHVDYRSAELRDLQQLAAAAHAAGARVVADLCHSAGVVPIALDAWGVDFAIGCTYKFLNGGPGAPAFIYVAGRLQDSVESPLPGWMGHDEPLRFEDEYRAAPGARRMLAGTPTILALAPLEAAIDQLLRADAATLRAKSSALGDSLIDLVDGRLDASEFSVRSPRAAADRGSQVSVACAQAAHLVSALRAARVVADHRPPNLIRFGLAPLYTSHADIFDAVDRLSALTVSRRPTRDARH